MPVSFNTNGNRILQFWKRHNKPTVNDLINSYFRLENNQDLDKL